MQRRGARQPLSEGRQARGCRAGRALQLACALGLRAGLRDQLPHALRAAQASLSAGRAASPLRLGSAGQLSHGRTRLLTCPASTRMGAKARHGQASPGAWSRRARCARACQRTRAAGAAAASGGRQAGGSGARGARAGRPPGRGRGAPGARMRRGARAGRGCRRPARRRPPATRPRAAARRRRRPRRAGARRPAARRTARPPRPRRPARPRPRAAAPHPARPQMVSGNRKRTGVACCVALALAGECCPSAPSRGHRRPSRRMLHSFPLAPRGAARHPGHNGQADAHTGQPKLAPQRAGSRHGASSRPCIYATVCPSSSSKGV